MLTNILLYSSTILHILLGLYVGAQRIRNPLNLSFGIFSISISLWSLTNALFQSAGNSVDMFTWALLAYTSASILVISLFAFSIIFTNTQLKLYTKLIFVAVGIASLTLPYIPNMVISGVDFNTKSIKGAELLPLLFVTYLIFMVFSILFLSRSRNKETIYLKRKQKTFVLYGILIAMIAGVTTNLILPSFNNYSLVGIGPAFTLVTLIFIFLSIFKYGLLEVRIITGRITYYFILSIVLMSGFYLAYFIDIILWGNVTQIQAIVTGIPVSFIFLIFYDSFRDFLKKNITSKIINPGYDPSEIIKEFNKRITSLIDINEINHLLKDILNKTIRPMSLDIKIIDSLNEQNTLDLLALKLSTIWQNEKYEFISTDILETDSSNIYKDLKELIKPLSKSIKDSDISLIISLVDKDDLIGFIFLGHPEESHIYTISQQEMLTALAQTYALSLSRSQLYNKVKTFNKDLQHEIDNATVQLQQKNKQLEEQLRKEKDMMDILGHELRTPLSIARNAVAMMKTALPKIKESDVQFELNNLYTKALENIRREVKILETVLSSTRIENNRIQITMEKVDVKDVVNVAIEGNMTDAVKKNLKLYTVSTEENILAFAARDQMQEVVDNLVSNAIKYTDKGEIRIELSKENGYVVVSVKDTGEGIPPEEIPNLGKKFYRINPYLSDGNERMNVIRPGGTGIGLYVVFNLVKLMRGTIEIKSQVGVGSNFTIRIPGFNVIEKEIKPSNNI